MITRKLKYPHILEDIDIIIDRLLHEEITKFDIADEYKVPYHTIFCYVKKAATAAQRSLITDRGHIISGYKRRGTANNPSGGKKGVCKIRAFKGIYADTLSPVRHRIVRPASIQSKNATFKVQSKLDDGIWYSVDILTCADDAFELLEQLYLYTPEDLAGITDPDSHNDQESV